LTLNYIYVVSSLLFSFYLAYVLGANTVGLVNGLYILFISNILASSILFGTATAVGILFLSGGITKSIGKGIIGISPLSALAAQMGGALTTHYFTQFGIPVSVTQALIGGIFGIGLAKRIVLANKRIIRGIMMGWALAPLSGFVISYLLSMIT
jgi:PiT family inorganic phosphate transporter